jgi:hypothetical protein
MIRYALVCAKGHEFESWFAGSAAFDRQAKRGLVECPICGSAKVGKALMTPRLARSGKSSPAAPAGPETAAPQTAAPETAAPEAAAPDAPAASRAAAPVAVISPQERELRTKLRELREHLVKNADNVGQRFPEEARKMHYGEKEHRSIYGTASPDDAKALHEEGIAFAPLPVLPDERN